MRIVPCPAKLIQPVNQESRDAQFRSVLARASAVHAVSDGAIDGVVRDRRSLVGATRLMPMCPLPSGELPTASADSVNVAVSCA